jgi:hypothetical protein
MISRCKISWYFARRQSLIHGISHTHDMVYVNEKPLKHPIPGISAAITKAFTVAFQLHLQSHFSFLLLFAYLCRVKQGQQWNTTE